MAGDERNIDADTDPDVVEDDGLLDPEDTLDDRDQLDEGYSPPERPYAVDDWGTTGAEEAAGESWAGRLERELPDGVEDQGDGLGDTADTDGELLDDQVGDARSGRLSDEGRDQHGDQVTLDVGIDGGAASAEEAAVHVVDGDDGDDDLDDTAAEFLRRT